MITLRVLCVIVVVAVGVHAEGPHSDPHPAPAAHAVPSPTIFRESVVKSKSVGTGKGIPNDLGVHGGSVAHGTSAHGPVSHGGSVFRSGPVSHGGGVFHSGPVSRGAVFHSEPVNIGGSVSHGPVSHGGAVFHSEPVNLGVSMSHAPANQGYPLTHSGSVVHSGPLVHSGSVVHGGPVIHDSPVSHGDLLTFGNPVLHGDSMVHGGLVFHRGSEVHGGPIVHDGSVVHDGPVSHGAYRAPLVRKTTVVHQGPILKTDDHGPVVSGPAVHARIAAHDVPVVADQVISAPVVHKAPTVSYSYGRPQHAPVLSQYQAQDKLGQYSFGYNAGDSARDESRDAYGNVRGSFSYVDDYGKIQTQHYVADGYGFRVAGTNLPVHVTEVPSYRHKRSYATFPASTGPLGSNAYGGPITTVSRVVNGPVVVSQPGPHGSSYGHDNFPLGSSLYGVSTSYSGPSGYGTVGRVSSLLGDSNLHGNFNRYGKNGYSFGFETGPSSLTTYGTHFDQQNRRYGAH